MFLLDTDVVSLLLRDQGYDHFPQLTRRVSEAIPGSLYVSVVTVKELVEGALALVRREEGKGAGTQGYALLVKVVLTFKIYPIVALTDADLVRFQAMSPAVKRNGRGDCLIAATALERNLTVVTRNLRHFEQIEGVRCEDWTQA